MSHQRRYTQNPVTLITVSALCALYLLFSVGVLKATHFCMGREASVAYFTSETEKCFCGKFAKEGEDCCDDSHELVKLEDSQKIINTLLLSGPDLALLREIYHRAVTSQYTAPVASRFIERDTPPPLLPLFVLHCSFVYYDRESVA